jgi:cardiolipin synthase
MSIPNVLTIIRILLTPVLIWLLLSAQLTQALVVFVVAGMTDGLDGLIARLLQQRTRLGAFLDPLADKILLMSSFVLLGRLHLVPSWLVVIAVSRDALILLGLSTLFFHHVAIEIKPSVVSKITTLFQLMTVLTALSSAMVVLPAWSYLGLFAITAVLTVVSGLHYIHCGLQLLETGRNNHGGPRG